MIHDTRDRGLGYDQVITDPEAVVFKDTGDIEVKDNGIWYNCHPKPLYKCLMKEQFPEGGYGVRWRISE